MLSVRAFRGGRELQEVPALRGVTFTAREGETIGVVGHNGSGKSTLFRAMSGLIPTSSGTIMARDRPVLLGVNAALVPELSGENNIKLGLLAMGFTSAEAAAKVDEIADFAELNEFIHHPMRAYSSGMGARLRFAIASAKAHSILLIDEALSVGDRRFKVKSEKRIRELRDSAGLVMIVSHSIGSLRDTCERVLWIHKGELRADGAAGDVIADYLKWTKQPGGAVGAAPAVKPPARATKQTVAVSVPAVADERDSELLGPLDSQVTADTSSRTNSARTAARRERYRAVTRKRDRRRLVAGIVTGGAILAAVGAGAAIALLTGLPTPRDRPDPKGSFTPVEQVPAVISSFATGTPVAQCASPEGQIPVSLNWDVRDAKLIALAAGPAQVDAIDQPMQTTLAGLGIDHVVAFSCADASTVYTLTAEGTDGSRSSSTVTVTRALPTTDETDSSSGRTDTGETDVEEEVPDTPVVPNPAIPTPDPTPTDPDPTETPDPQPTSNPTPTQTEEPVDPATEENASTTP
ncbi:ABC transporter ATP-binding protein [Microbacterium lacticum]|uniref:ABC transporter ATP-binding protein n=1 Tax=Microbacterium lacticum TaxID=33885 RepID=UPI001F59AD64|nr:ABC transporter ATP-binding protein [Microbacterium lacticum]